MGHLLSWGLSRISFTSEKFHRIAAEYAICVRACLRATDVPTNAAWIGEGVYSPKKMYCRFEGRLPMEHDGAKVASVSNPTHATEKRSV